MNYHKPGDLCCVYKMKFIAVGLLLLAKYSLQQSFTLSQPATSIGPSIICQGSDVTLQCVILRNGVAVDILWRRNKTIVDINELTNHQNIFNSTYNAFTDLVITNVTLEDDNTEYNCTAVGTDISSSIVLNMTGLPFIEMVTTSVCSASVRLSSSRNDICGPIGYSVQLLNNDRVLKNMTTDDLDIPMLNLAPDTNYTITIVTMQMDNAGVARMTRKRIFGTSKPTGEIFTATWHCDESTICGILANWTTITETNENCSPIKKLELEGLGASSDTVTVDNTTTTKRSYTALIPVDELITSTVLIATYDGGVTRSSGLINFIAGSNFLLHTLEGEFLFINEQIIVNASWRGATNLGIAYIVSLICDNNYMPEENMVVDMLMTNFTVTQNETVDNIECKVTVSIDEMLTIAINISLGENRMSTSSPSTDNYCEDNPGVCIGIPVVVAIAILIVLAVVVLLLACSNSRRMLLSLFNQNSKTSVVSKTQAADNEYVIVTEAADTNVQPSGESDTISLQNTDSAVAAANEKPKYAEVTLPDNLPIHIPPNNVVPYVQIQH